VGRAVDVWSPWQKDVTGHPYVQYRVTAYDGATASYELLCPQNAKRTLAICDFKFDVRMSR
jgi:hypothetical protein